MGERLKDKVILLTGAAGCLGRDIALRFVQQGAKLAVCDRRGDELEETVKICREAGGKVISDVFDLTNEEDLDAWIKKAGNEWGGIDGLVNASAPDYPIKPFLELTDDDILNSWEGGLVVVWNTMQKMFPYMKEKGGSIVNLLSPCIGEAMYQQTAVAADKGGIRALSMSVSRDWGKYGIRVNTVTPHLGGTIYDTIPENDEFIAFYRTIQESHYGVPAGTTGEPKNVSDAVVFFLSDEASWVTGQNLNVDGGRVTLFI